MARLPPAETGPVGSPGCLPRKQARRQELALSGARHSRGSNMPPPTSNARIISSKSASRAVRGDLGRQVLDPRTPGAVAELGDHHSLGAEISASTAMATSSDAWNRPHATAHGSHGELAPQHYPHRHHHTPSADTNRSTKSRCLGRMPTVRKAAHHDHQHIDGSGLFCVSPPGRTPLFLRAYRPLSRYGFQRAPVMQPSAGAEEETDDEVGPVSQGSITYSPWI